jgi:AbrB family looped-hinge helix DNA binding protein
MLFFRSMKRLYVSVDKAGRILLPNKIREELSIQPGEAFTLSIKGRAIILTRCKAAGRFIKKGKALVFSTPRGPSINRKTVQEILTRERGRTAGNLALRHIGRTKAK